MSQRSRLTTGGLCQTLPSPAFACTSFAKSGDSARLRTFFSPMRARLAGRRSCSAGPFGREQLTKSLTRRKPKVLEQLNSWLQETKGSGTSAGDLEVHAFESQHFQRPLQTRCHSRGSRGFPFRLHVFQPLQKRMMLQKLRSKRELLWFVWIRSVRWPFNFAIQRVMRRMGRVFGLGRPVAILSRRAVGRFLCRAVGQEQLTNAQTGNFAASSFSGSSAIPSASSKRAQTRGLAEQVQRSRISGTLRGSGGSQRREWP